jgi:hypothetical protein
VAAEGLSVALARERGRFGCLVDVSVELSFSWLRRELLRHVYNLMTLAFVLSSGRLLVAARWAIIRYYWSNALKFKLISGLRPGKRYSAGQESAGLLR